MALQLHQLSQPTENDIQAAMLATEDLKKILSRGKIKLIKLQTQIDSKTASTVIPDKAFELIIEILGQMANGNIVTVVPIHAELTTQQAADLLNVSRPYIVKLIKDGELPAKMVGTRRRVRMEDLIVYQRHTDKTRRKVLRKLTREAQDLGLGY